MRPSPIRVAARIAGLYDIVKELAPGQVWKIKGAFRLRELQTYITPPSGRIFPYSTYIGDAEPTKIETPSVEIEDVEIEHGFLVKSLVLKVKGKLFYFGRGYQGRPNSTQDTPSVMDLQAILEKQVGGPSSEFQDERAVSIGSVVAQMKSIHKGGRVFFTKGAQHIFGGTEYEKMEDGPKGRWLMVSGRTGKIPFDWESNPSWLRNAEEVAREEQPHMTGFYQSR